MKKYKCSKCGKIVKRNSTKQWIKSYCDLFDCYSRLILIKSNQHDLNTKFPPSREYSRV